jgi:hypothetical protein
MRTFSAWLAVPEAGLGMNAGGLQPVAAEFAGPVGDRERRDHQVAPLDGGDLGPGVLDDADELVPHRAGPSSGFREAYGHKSLPQITDAVILTSASVGSLTAESGTCSTRTSPAAYMTVARISECPSTTSGSDQFPPGPLPTWPGGRESGAGPH